MHFEDSQFTDPHKKNRLKPLKAVPTVFDIPNPPPKFANLRPAPREREVKECYRRRKFTRTDDIPVFIISLYRRSSFTGVSNKYT